MSRKAQQKLTLDFSLTFTEGTAEFDGAYYVVNGPLPKKEAITVAIASLFSSVGAAMRGSDRDVINERVSYSNESLYGFIQLALVRSGAQCSVFEGKPENNSESDIRLTQPRNLIDQNEVF